MTRRIHKYQLPLDGKMSLPRNSTLLYVNLQAGVPTLWAEVTPGLPLVDHLIGVYGTGFALPDVRRTYLGTVIDGALVWHVYDLGETD